MMIINNHYPGNTMEPTKEGLNMKKSNFEGSEGKFIWAGENRKEIIIIKRGGKHDAFFCIGFSQLWWEKIHSVIKRLQNTHCLKCPWVRICYQQGTNIGEILQGDIVGQIMKIISLRDFLKREYICNSPTRVKGTCAYRG